MPELAETVSYPGDILHDGQPAHHQLNFEEIRQIIITCDRVYAFNLTLCAGTIERANSDREIDTIG